MLVSQARISFSGSAGWLIAWAGVPPGSGQSRLTPGGGRVIEAAARFGSGSTRPPIPSTEIRSPGSGCFLSRNQSHAAGPSASSSAAKSRRFMANAGRLGFESRGHLGGAGAQALRRRQVVGEFFVDREGTPAVARFELCRGGQVERAGAPWIAARDQRLEMLDRPRRIAVRQKLRRGQ